LTAAGAPARVEEARFRGDFAAVVGTLAAAGAAAAVAATTKRGRRAGAVAGAAVAALIADDISNGARPFRKLVRPERTTWNVVAEAGDADAERTVVVLAHHDAAQTGFIFDPGFQERLIDRFPGIVERVDTSLPLWWPVLAGPLLATAGGLSGRRGLAAAGALISAGAAATMADIQRSPTVPGANDNLTAVAVIVALAEALAAEPVSGLRVQLVSVGAEEVLQGGIYGYCADHLAKLDRERTWFLNVETVGGPSLALIEGEGCVVMEDYFDRPWRDLIASVAARDGVPLRRGMRSRSSTDSVIPSRMGVPTATIAAIDRYKALSNYHRMTDVPENICWPTVACAADLSEAVVRALAPGSAASGPG
ncbi:MAG TPA: M28 family peptidase, partial [Solirubrobacterales bacterium]|nr:M28 family peptidase [Solirubrobacterales bacterium]